MLLKKVMNQAFSSLTSRAECLIRKPLEDLISMATLSTSVLHNDEVH